MNHPLRSDNWEATYPKHGARVCCDCSGQPSSNRRPNSQVGRLEASCPTRLSRECASRLGTANIDENKYNDRRNTKTRVEKCSMQLNFLLCLSLIMAMCRSMPCLYYLWTEIFNHLWHTQTCTLYTSSDKINSSLFVFICVALSVLEIIGGAYFMGLTIEIVTSIVLILRYKRSNKDFNPSCNLSVGLALDYAAHIGVTYVVTKGRSRKERAQASVARLFFCAFFVWSIYMRAKILCHCCDMLRIQYEIYV